MEPSRRTVAAHRAALEAAKRVNGERAPEIAPYAAVLGTAMLEGGLLEAAACQFQEAIMIHDLAVQDDPAQRALQDSTLMNILDALARIYEGMSLVSASIVTHARYVQLLRETNGECLHLAEALAHQAGVLAVTGDVERSHESLDEALFLVEREQKWREVEQRWRYGAPGQTIGGGPFGIARWRPARSWSRDARFDTDEEDEEEDTNEFESDAASAAKGLRGTHSSMTEIVVHCALAEIAVVYHVAEGLSSEQLLPRVARAGVRRIHVLGCAATPPRVRRFVNP